MTDADRKELSKKRSGAGLLDSLKSSLFGKGEQKKPKEINEPSTETQIPVIPLK